MLITLALKVEMLMKSADEQSWEALSGQRWIPALGDLEAFCDWSDRGEVK